MNVILMYIYDYCATGKHMHYCVSKELLTISAD